MKRALAVIALGVVAAAGAGNAEDLRPRAFLGPPAYNWSGCYVGAEGGGAWGHSQDDFNDPSMPALIGRAQTNGIYLSGGLAGGTVGCNYQFFGNWVIGAENDLSWTNAAGSADAIAPFTKGETFQTSQSWLDTVRGRLGYALDRWFVYGTGGAAFTHEQIQICALSGICASAAQSVTGWTAGGGIAYAFALNWSAKLEYLHADFGSTGFARLNHATSPNGATFFDANSVSLSDELVRVGVDYKFW
jgi:outer membrane immunogenic protein